MNFLTQMQKWALCLFIGICSLLPLTQLTAQIVTQSWATGASSLDIVIDASGNVYTANSNNTVSKITSAGVVTQAWATLAAGTYPLGITVDASGNVYTANHYGNTVSKITPAGVVTQAWATLAAGSGPFAIAIDASGNLYTANFSNSTVSKITSAGVVTQAWATLSAWSNPYSIAIDASGNVYTANIGDNTVSKTTSAGVVTPFWAILAAGASPRDITIDASGNVYTAIFSGNGVSKITSAGVVTQAWATLAAGAKPEGIAIDASGNLYTANYSNSTVSKITSAGVVTQAWATLAAGAKPRAITVDASGNFFYTANDNSTVSKIAPPASITITSGNQVMCVGSVGSVTFTATTVASSPAYQWKKNNINVGTNSATYTDAALADGDVISCEVTDGAISLTTNAITITALPLLTPSVTIAANPSGAIYTTSSVTFTATPTDGGSAPSYQWQLNGVNVGTNSPTYTNNSWTDGDVVTCILTSNYTCATLTTATSNSITIAATTPPDATGLHFDGVNDFVMLPNINPISGGVAGEYTVETWLKLQSYNSATTWIYGDETAGNGGIIMQIDASGYIWTYRAAVGVVTSTAQVPLNTWTHIAFSQDASNLKLYVNGVFIQNLLSGANRHIETNNAPSIGATGGGRLLNGTVDEMRIWNRARTASEIANNRNCEFTGNESGLVAHYQFNQGAEEGTNTGITTLLDATSNANNGTLTNFALTGATSNWVMGNGNLGNTVVTPTVVVTSNDADNTINLGTSVTFTATPTNGGSAPTYQWKKNGNNVGTNSATYTDAALANGDVITVEMTSNATCVSPTTVTSSSITMTVNVIPATGLHFDGTNDHVSVPYSAALNSSTFTAESWVNIASPNASGYSTVLSSRNFAGGLVSGYMIYALGSNPASTTNKWLVQAALGNGSAWFGLFSNTAIVYNTWTHLAVTYDGTTMRLYINGVLDNSVVSTYSPNTVRPFLLGAGANELQPNYNSFFNGTLDETRVWTVARTQQQIATGLCDEMTTPQTGLALYYKFNQGTVNTSNSTVTTATDGSGNSRTGTLTNFALSGVASNWTVGYSNLGTFVTTTVTIVSDDADNSINAGESVTFTATPTNGGSAPTYQWKKNGNPVGTNAATYTDAALANGDAITVEMTSSLICASPATVTSNSIAMTVTVTPATGLNFDGANDFVMLPNIDPISEGVAGEYTVETWVKLNAYTSGLGSWIYGDETSNNGGIIIQINDAGYIWTYRQGAGIVTSTAQVPLNTWTHIAFSQDASDLKLYVNGVFVQNLLSGANLHIETSNAPSIGATSGLRLLNGTVDEMRIWKRARTASEIANSQNCELIGNESGLVAHYKFNQGGEGANNTGLTTLLDATSNANNGTLTNFALTGTTSNWGMGNGNLSEPIPSSVVVVSDDADNSINAGTSVTFTATPTNGGSTPTYQWKKNGNPVGTNAATYTDAALADGDVITVEMTSSSVCASPATVTSNTVIMTVNGVLPVEFLYFTGEATENGNLLTWATATEENNAGFEVEKSTDGRTFEKIDFVAGKGTTLEQQTYEFLDKNTTNGVTYYRLKQTDFNGKFEYSNIVSIANTNAQVKEVRLYPNPVKDVLTIENAAGMATIYNAFGQPLRQFEITDTVQMIEVNDLPKGVYTLQIRKTDGTAVIKQFIK